jgi:ATP synthase protein I
VGPPRRGWGQVGRYAGVGLELTSCVVGGLLIGMGLDHWLGTQPWLALACLLRGAAAGFVELFRALHAWQRQEEEASTSDRSSGPSSPSGSS